MNWNDLLLRLKALIFHGRAERELDEELEAHLDMQIEHGVRAVARLKPGTSIAQSRADLHAIARQLQHEFTENTGLDMDLSD